MRFVISLLISLPALGAPIRVFYEGSGDFAVKVRETLEGQYAIPPDLIGLGQVKSCEGLRKRGKLDLCLKNNGDLLVVSIDREFVSESLRIFRTP